MSPEQHRELVLEFQRPRADCGSTARALHFAQLALTAPTAERARLYFTVARELWEEANAQ